MELWKNGIPMTPYVKTNPPSLTISPFCTHTILPLLQLTGRVRYPIIGLHRTAYRGNRLGQAVATV